MANLDNGVILGALGSTFTNAADIVYPPTGMVIASIQFLGSGSATGVGIKPFLLVAENPAKFINTAEAANNMADASITVDEGGGGYVIEASAVEFPAGMVIYGRWTQFQVINTGTITGGGAICYFGY